MARRSLVVSRPHILPAPRSVCRVRCWRIGGAARRRFEDSTGAGAQARRCSGSCLRERNQLGFLGGYSGLTRDAYGLDLRQFASWCQQPQLALFDVARHNIETFARQLEELGRARATISRRLCTITSLYRYAVEEGLLDRSLQCMCADHDSTTSPTPPAWTATRSARCWSLPVSPALVGARDHALISLLALNGLRVSEAIGADIERLGLERDHRTLLVHRKGGNTSPSHSRPELHEPYIVSTFIAGASR